MSVYLVRMSTGLMCVSLGIWGQPDMNSRLGECALKIEDLHIVAWPLDQVTVDLITSLSCVIDSPVS